MRTGLICCFLFLQIVTALAQTVPSVNYTIKDGLVADRITCMSQDSLGMMWFGTFYGTSKYDGQHFETITFASGQGQKFVSTLFPFHSAVLAGLYFDGGMYAYEAGKSRAVKFPFDKPGVTSDVRVITDGSDGNALILASNDSMYVAEFKNGSIRKLFDIAATDKTNDFFQSIVQLADKSIWVGTLDGLLIFQRYGNKYKLAAKKFAGCEIFNLYKDPLNRVWITGKPGNKSFIAVGNNVATLKTIYSGGLINVNFNSKTASSFWAVNDKGVLFNITAEGKIEYFPFVVNDGAFISCIYCDRENNIWLGTDFGVRKIPSTHSHSFFFDQISGTTASISTLCKGTILASNNKELYAIQNDKFIKLMQMKEDKLNQNFLGSIACIGNTIWINRWNNGLWKLKWNGSKLTTKKFFKQFENGEITLSLFSPGENGTIWGTGGENLYLLDKNRILQKISLTDLIGKKMSVTAIAVDTTRKEIYIGHNWDGIYKFGYRKISNNHFTFICLNHYAKEDGLMDLHMRSLLLDSQGNLWAGTRFGGIYRSKINKGTKFINCNAAAGISCTRVTKIVEEKNRSVWFATCNGLYRFQFASAQWEHYDVSNGLSSAEVFDITIDDVNKKVWVVTTQAVTVLDYNAKKFSAPPPIVSITNVLASGEKISALTSGHEIKFPSDKNSISFNFTGCSFLDEKKVKYKYILEGFTEKWSAETTNASVEYGSLSPGSYTFKVMAVNAEGTWSEKPAMFSFKITQPFYRATWFLITLSIAVVILFYIIQHYWLMQKLKVQNIRLNIARDLHDDIGSALGSINILTKTATRKLEKAAPQEEIAGLFQKIGSSAQSTLESMDDIIWAINPDKDNWQDMSIRMKEFAIPLAESANIRLSMNLPSDYNQMRMDLRRIIFLIFKECITNSIKHSGCTFISVDLHLDHSMLSLTVTDDGKGFHPKTNNGRNGIKNIIHRASVLNGTVEITAAKPKGTSIHFCCPVR